MSVRVDDREWRKFRGKARPRTVTLSSSLPYAYRASEAASDAIEEVKIDPLDPKTDRLLATAQARCPVLSGALRSSLVVEVSDG